MSAVDTEPATFTGEVHPAAEAWPMLPEEEVAELAASIANNGLLEPLTIDAEGRLLDGRNRLAACKIACVEPVFFVYAGDPVAYVIGKNNDRRHMSTGARAMATGKNLADAGRRKNGRWQRGAVDSGGSANSGWQARMKEVGLVIDFSPADIEKVVHGDLALDAAYRKAQQIKEASESYDARLAKLAEEAADLAANVTDDASLAEAIGAYEARKAEEEKLFNLHLKQVQEAASAWALLLTLADRRLVRQAEVLERLNDTDRSLITEAITVIRKGR